MRLLFGLVFTLFSFNSVAQNHSIARTWNEEVLHAIRNDFARPTVHARNLWHTSAVMYDLWATITDGPAEPYFLGKTVQGFEIPFLGIPDYTMTDEEAVNIAICHAVYTLINHRFSNSSLFASNIRPSIRAQMDNQGLNWRNQSTNYQTGGPEELGNYLGQMVIQFGLQDNSWEQLMYNNRFYEPVNTSLIMEFPGNPVMEDPNRWQPLTLEFVLDQNDMPLPTNTPPFLSPEWGQVVPFALSEDDLTIYERDGFDYYVYHDPGAPPYVDTLQLTQDSEEFLWGFSMVSTWSSHLDPSDGVMIDISPGASGNLDALPNSIAEYRDYYNYLEGGDPSTGHPVNPHTGLPYEPNVVPRGDYARVLAEFWADGPESETPPGHWFTILNYVNDHPELSKKYRGVSDEWNELEWDVKAYFLLGGAMHDCAISAWGIKGHYDYVRPVSAIRAMAERGQSTNQALPNFHPAGLPLVPGYIQVVSAGDPLAGPMGDNVGKIKLNCWRGPEYIQDPEVDLAGVGWILAENWWPYQRPTFVTPNFAGYISGHSTYSRAAAEVLTSLTGDPFFPGGMGEFFAPQNEFLVFEEGPSQDITLQWATYRDASNQTSLSRIWGGIHPPADDIPGRHIGIQIAEDALELAETYFFSDADNDGYYNYEDCNDNDPDINPASTEICDGLDNNCAGGIDEGLQLYTYFLDQDGDGFGDQAFPYDTCQSTPIIGYIDNAMDCDDSNPDVNPIASETCDGIDNNCSGAIDDGLQLFTYFLDNDNDGFGDLAFPYDTCQSTPILGYIDNSMDCNDADPNINPLADEICDTIDNDCSGRADDNITTIRYFQDADGDGFGSLLMPADTCITYPPVGFVVNSDDCDDGEAGINPSVVDIPDNQIDEDCSGVDLYEKSVVFPNPFSDIINIRFNSKGPIDLKLFDSQGRHVELEKIIEISENNFQLDFSRMHDGLYYLWILDPEDSSVLHEETIVKYNQY